MPRKLTDLTCPRCGSSERFRMRAGNPSGECKNCHRLRQRKRQQTANGIAQRRAYYDANAERYREYSRMRAKSNPERNAAYARADYERHQAARKEAARMKYKKNPDAYIRRAQLREEHIRQRTPKWADLDAIEGIYREAKRMTVETGAAHHVDHIFPLRGRMCSGLHVSNNLRIVPAHINLRKSNRMPA